MNSLPGFDTVQGSKPDAGLPERDALPRLKRINRKQLLLKPIDVEALVPEDHDVRAIWEFTGHLDLTAYYETIRAVEGRGRMHSLRPAAACEHLDLRL
ncbi:MAG: hypothetical protein ABSC19_11010 [Syntrophorhabdales bacterium]|jgi:transposase